MKTVNECQVYTTLAEIADPEHTALLVVDMQNDYIARGGASDKAGRRDTSAFKSVIAQTKCTIEAARQAKVPVVYIQNTWLPNHRSVSGAWLRFIERSGFLEGASVTVDGTWGHRIVDELAPRPEDIIVKKWRASAFIGTNLDLVLRCNRIESVVVTGVVTQGCVESTARDAAFLDYYVVVLGDCVQSTRQDLHEASLQVMAARFDVVDSDEVLRVWLSQPVSLPAREEVV
ncbi:MAG: isochorismatase family protein [Chloroflexi bacterium]|nr:isochorismatase family protein [Chloroflexota bacterium]